MSFTGMYLQSNCILEGLEILDLQKKSGGKKPENSSGKLESDTIFGVKKTWNVLSAIISWMTQTSWQIWESVSKLRLQIHFSDGEIVQVPI